METESRQTCFWHDEVRRFLPDPECALADALGYVCCPVCKVLSDVSFEYFRQLPRRWSDEPAMHRTVCRARGFCRAHMWSLARIQGQITIAQVCADVLDAATMPSAPVEPCPVCHLRALVEVALVEHLGRRLADAEARRQYGRLLGVCYPHLEQLLQLDLAPGARETLLSCQEARRVELVGNLRSFAEKSSPPAKWTRTDDENRAPQRALLKLVGDKEA